MAVLYLFLILATFAVVIMRGGVEERVLVAVLMGSSVATLFLVSIGLQFRTDPLAFAVVELSALAIIMVIAFRSSRFWPLPYAALQIATVLSLLSPLFGENLLSYALGVMQAVWAYPQLLILVLASVRTRRVISTTP